MNRRLTGRTPSCGPDGGESLLAGLRKRVRDRGIDVDVVAVHCFGKCELGPNVRLAGGAFIHGASPERLDELIDRLLARAGA